MNILKEKMKVCGNWVLLKPVEKKTKHGIISKEDSSAVVVGIGEECPKTVKGFLGYTVFYKKSRTEFTINKYIVIEWPDILYTEE
jgi:hypothetical protein